MGYNSSIEVISVVNFPLCALLKVVNFVRHNDHLFSLWLRHGLISCVSVFVCLNVVLRVCVCLNAVLRVYVCGHLCMRGVHVSECFIT